jgi:4-amino-4-deoxy-L-arabinose transferase-like glycosyltransferase
MGGGAFLAVTLLWFVPAVIQGGLEYAQTTLLHHSLERYVKAWEHNAPWYFYLGAFPAEFLPWTLFLPQALIAVGKWQGDHEREGWWFALCWLVAILGFFSLSTGKRDIYILPAFPAAALLVGWVWSGWWRFPSTATSWGLRLPVLALALALCALALGIGGGVDDLLPDRSKLLLPATPAMGLWGSRLLMLAGILLGGAAISYRPRTMYGLIVGWAWIAMLVTVGWVYTPQFNQRYPIKAFAAVVLAQVPADHPLQLCGPLNDVALKFNLRRYVPELQQIPAVVRYLEQDGAAFCVIEAEEYQRLREFTGRSFPILARQTFDRASLLLISN